MSTETPTAPFSNQRLPALYPVRRPDALHPIGSVAAHPQDSERYLRRYRDNEADIAASTQFELDIVHARAVFLGTFPKVYYHHGRHYWLVLLNEDVKPTRVPLHIGQRPVYVKHGDRECSMDVDDILGLDPEKFDPTTVLSDETVRTILSFFRHAVGIRVHVWGFIDVLFPTEKAIWRQKALRRPVKIGGLGYAFIVMSYHPTAHLPAFRSAAWKRNEEKEQEKTKEK
ncbi:hypothetical protein C8R46DRAFT_457701 [Mycena filopes]|nr:hypothetical protein C8R46DRAFT_457701 [Mycena filopes]